MVFDEILQGAQCEPNTDADSRGALKFGRPGLVVTVSEVLWVMSAVSIMQPCMSCLQLDRDTLEFLELLITKCTSSHLG